MSKHFFLLLSTILLTLTVRAQISYGLKAGMTISKFTALEGPKAMFPVSSNTSDELGFSSTGKENGFYLTGYIDVAFSRNLSFQPGISLQNKGGAYVVKDNLFDMHDYGSSYDFMYIEIPLNCIYNLDAGSGNIFVGAGPYIAYGISVKAIVEPEEIVKRVYKSFEEANLKPFDTGVNFLGGYKFKKGLLINAGYGLGLTNIAKNKDNISLKNRVLSFGVGYQF